MATYLSHSAAHYLMAIRDLLRERGYARGVDIAERLGVSRTAAYLALRSLKERGLVEEDERHFYSLAADGDALAARFTGNQEMMLRFFRDILGLAPDEAERNACDIEHHLSENASRSLLAFLRFLLGSRGGRNLIRRFQLERKSCPQSEKCEIAAPFDQCPFNPRRHRGR